jgi:ubiquinone/menaquinone biosynthesis C-methylase UbiE
MSTSRFNQAAATWDQNPRRVEMSRRIAAKMLEERPVQSDMTVIDYGCGTGVVALELAPFVARMIGVDSSPAMLAELRKKADAAGLGHVETLVLDLSVDPLPDGLHADLIISAMALHHVADIPALLRAFTAILNPGGSVALTDLDTEDGTFHDDHTGVHHHGLDRDWLCGQLTALGFQDVSATTAYVAERERDGVVREYPAFLVSGQKA